MGTIRGYSVHKPRNISRDYSPTHCWLKCPFQGKQAAPPLQPLKRWKTQTLGALETTLDNIRNRDHSVHRLSAVRALNLHRRRSTCVLLTSVGANDREIRSAPASQRCKATAERRSLPLTAMPQPLQKVFHNLLQEQLTAGTSPQGRQNLDGKRWLLDPEEHQPPVLRDRHVTWHEVEMYDEATDHRGGLLPNIGPRGQSRTNRVGSQVTLVSREDQQKHEVAVNQ